jgi:drug/metabolite transporter (DMT)-like permease
MSTLDTSPEPPAPALSRSDPTRPAPPGFSHVPSRPRLAAGAIGITVVLWASAFVAIRHVGDDISAGPLSLGRCAVASVVLGALLLRRGAVRPRAGQLGRLVVCGALWFGVYNVALNAAEQRVDAGTAAMLVNLGPVLIAVLGGLVLGEGFPRRLMAGVAIAFGGVVLIGLATSSGTTDLSGVALCLAAAVAYAVSVIAQKPLLATMSALQVTWTACTIGAIVCLPFAPDLLYDVRTSPPSALGWVVYLGLMPTAAAFTTWAYALARSSAGRLGSTTYLVPPLTITLGWAFLGETPPVLALAGGALCLVGVATARRRTRPGRGVRA